MATPIRSDLPSLEVLRKRHEDTSWDRDQLSLARFQGCEDPCSVLLGHFDLSLIIAQADHIREHKEWREFFTLTFQMPQMWWAHCCKNSNGYFGCESTRNPDASFSGYNTWLKALVKQTYENSPKGQKDYIWLKYNIFTRWLPATKQTVILIFDPKPAVKDRLLAPELYRVDPLASTDPYWIHGILLEELLQLQDNAVWGIRNLVRQTEIHRSSPNSPHPDFLRLHDIARHAIHVSETLDLAVTTVEMMTASHDAFIRSQHATDEATRNTQNRLQSRLQFYNHMTRSLRYRAASNKERLSNEIQYAFNTVTQYDSRIGVEIGRAAQSDSAAMKTIAFLTLTFLPATYICAIFSMSFFNYNPDTGEWRVAKDFWVYWVVAVPITFITALLWSFWHKFFPQKLVGEEKLPARRREIAKHELHDLKEKLAGHSSGAPTESKV